MLRHICATIFMGYFMFISGVVFILVCIHSVAINVQANDLFERYCVSRRRDTVSLVFDISDNVWYSVHTHITQHNSNENGLRCTFIIISDIYSTELCLFDVNCCSVGFYRYLLRVHFMRAENVWSLSFVQLDRPLFHPYPVAIEQNMAFERHCICHYVSIRKMKPSNLSNIIYVRPFTATDASVPWVFIIKLLVRTIIGENLTTPTGCSATLSSVIITVFWLVSMESFGIKWNVNVLRQSCGHSMWGSGFYLSNPVDDSMIHKQHFTFPIDFEIFRLDYMLLRGAMISHD